LHGWNRVILDVSKRDDETYFVATTFSITKLPQPAALSPPANNPKQERRRPGVELDSPVRCLDDYHQLEHEFAVKSDNIEVEVGRQGVKIKRELQWHYLLTRNVLVALLPLFFGCLVTGAAESA